MVVSGGSSGSAGGSTDYLLDGKKTKDLALRLERQLEKNAQILMSNGVREPDGASDTINRAQLIKDFKMQASLNPALKKHMQHISISFNPLDSDKVNDELMKDVARDYIKLAGYENTQYIVVKHNDTKHKHFHILANRVDNFGKTISDKFSKMRDIERSQRLAKKYNLTPTLGSKKEKENSFGIEIHERKNDNKNLDRTNFDKLSKDQQAKYRIYLELKRLLAEKEKLRNIMELKEQLSLVEIAMQLHEKDEKIIGISFENDGYKFSGVQVDKSLSYSKIKEQLEQKLIPKQEEQSRVNESEKIEKPRENEVKVQIEYSLEELQKRKIALEKSIIQELDKAKSTKEFSESLKREGISIKQYKESIRIIYFEKDGILIEKSSAEILIKINENSITSEQDKVVVNEKQEVINRSEKAKEEVAKKEPIRVQPKFKMSR